jgi:hypothetical protein
MPTLRAALDDLARHFADDVLAVIREASLEDLLGEMAAPRGRGRPARTAGGGQLDPLRRRRRGRLARRTPGEIAKTVAAVVALVRGSKAGLRSEQIRAALKLDRRELPRVLYEAMKAKKVRSRGQRRGTTYFAT